MSRIIVNGSKVQIASGYQTAFTISAITNAANAVATLSASHGVVANDYIEITSCTWPSLVGRVFKVSALSTNDATLSGCDTSDTAKFPAGTITGGGKEVTAWVDVAQVNELNVSGGEMQYQQGQYLDVPMIFKFPTVTSAIDVSINVDDDQSQAFWSHVISSQNSQANRAMRVIDANAIARIVGTGIWARSAAPAMAQNNVYKRTITVALAAAVTEYSS
jgi:hypothetical protein